MARLIVGPFNRVEGDLEVRLEVVDGQVQSAHINSPMYRGFEQILLKKPAMDALIYVPRICGICSVSQSVASARALADAMGVTPPPNGARVTNLMLATENMADHLTHFYLFFMPDFARPVYAQQPWHAAVQDRFTAMQGRHARLALAARQRLFTLLGTLGGKWPHTQSIQPTGSSRAVEAAERVRLLARVREFRAFLEQTLFAAPLEQISAIDSEAALRQWYATAAPDSGDFRLFLTLAWQLELDRMGPGPGRYMSNGSYPSPDGGLTFARGIWDQVSDKVQALDTDSISEDATHAWLSDAGGARHPADGLTVPDIDKPDAYTWNKAPRLDGRVIETGALARQLVDAHPLIRDAAMRCGGTVYTRVLARLLELARVVPAMEEWIKNLRTDEPYFVAHALPDDAVGMGLTEAARGSLGHWIAIRKGKISNYQIIAPTSWNFSPRDAQGVPGALEAALVGAAVLPGEDTPVSVQHIVRSFDPCMVCTVH
ncbi:nickel-dependent hydrogenase large subunit [Herbaspirillum sp. RTI4]|uniref:nickel-dependent hydrogenase large subunit n=1 Tax=Herbaspirillum sp. RTI4 TaxID=3048640 RepID=UPI002AB4088B|nr:nickel-dependent hydrogenase large subunit [Herbaspirillum sp. RTI4]MDY7577054.1 nickel-dependent hydrogenase large subunit [Herbaspirillum sp. RTI4]MEA9982234.1 nickel-dependent hydrogenase large subunit [Herbaspirillum sp. RTI4]